MSVKVYISNEIRRFPLAPYSTYNSLLGKIHSFDEKLRNASVKICWKDAENDPIVIKSDEDLKEALANRPADNLLRLCVSCDDNSPPPCNVDHAGANGQARQIGGDHVDAAAPEPLHDGVVCDGCDGAVRGSRFKCMACKNYDLCSACEAHHKHDQHPMLRLRSPTDISWKLPFQQSMLFSRMFGAIDQWRLVTGQEYLSKVGDTLSSVMKDFGVDVDYEIRGPRETVPQAEQQTPQPTNQQPTQENHTPEATMREEKAAVPAPEQKDVPPANDWIMLDRASGNEVNEVEAATIYPTAPTSPELDAVVNRSLMQMRSMGFTNGQDLLKRLLYQKNGDVSAVLDTLNLSNLALLD